MLKPEAKPEVSEKFTPHSSFIELVEYDSKNLSMTLTFKTGSQTKYLYVYPSTYASFKQAESHGTYYAKVIKGKLNGVAVQSHNVSTKHKTQPLNKQPRSQPYGSNALNRSVRAANRGANDAPRPSGRKPAKGNVKSGPGNTPDAFGLQSRS